MLARWVRTWDSQVLRPLLLFLCRLGVTPNGLTTSGLIVVVISGIVLAKGYLVVGGCLLLFGGFLDGLDGELARLSNHETHFGAFLDSIFDHCGDFAVYFGLLWLYLNSNSRIEVILIFLALFGSILGSQVRSRAGMMGIDTKTTGVFTRFERIFVLTIGLVTDKVIFALWVLAVMNNFSALQRIVYSIQAGNSSKTQIKEKGE